MTQEEFDKEYLQIEEEWTKTKANSINFFINRLSTEAIYFALNQSGLGIWSLEFIRELNKEFNNRLNTVIEKEVLDN